MNFEMLEKDLRKVFVYFGLIVIDVYVVKDELVFLMVLSGKLNY